MRATFALWLIVTAIIGVAGQESVAAGSLLALSMVAALVAIGAEVLRAGEEVDQVVHRRLP